MKIEQTECSETPAHKIQTPGNYPSESIQHTAFHLIFLKPNTFYVLAGPSGGNAGYKMFPNTYQ
jgi:hypothetical protein